MAHTLELKQLFQFSREKAMACLNKTFVGIDFGTSTTVVSVATVEPNTGDIQCETIQLEQTFLDGHKMEGELLPTVIAEADGLLVGQGAYELKGKPDYTFGENIWHSFKMELGKDLGPRWFKSKHSKIKSPQDATKIFFKYLKSKIEKYCKQNSLGLDIQYAVSIPASFESNQRKDLIDALAANNISISGHNLIDEPNAAFLGYINPDAYYKEPIKLKAGYNPKVLVFDFGAGTCDISILELVADFHGLNTRNISISQFTELGGNDIDRYIACNYLLPRILKLNNIDEDSYTTTQLNIIVNQLMGIAERLKIQACNAFSFYLGEKDSINDIADTGQSVKVKIPTCIYTDYKDLEQTEFVLSYKEFVETMKVFFKNDIWSKKTVVKHQKEYNSIYATIDSAITKAHIDKDQIDYVMMIGGSSKNPFVQQAITKYFKRNTTILMPQDLQALVSQGASIHSLLSNGMGITVVRPITSERIIAVLRGGDEMPIIPAGTEIPFAPVSLDNFSTGDQSQKIIEIPICVSNKEKVLANIKIENPSGEPFPKDETIILTLEMSADKLLKATASIAGINCTVQYENPFANTYLTNQEKRILKAQRKTYVSANKNGGRPSQVSLRDLRQAYIDADKDFQAAETYEEEISYYPRQDVYNYIGVLYHNSGNINKAIRFFRKAINANPNEPRPHSNLGHDLFLIGQYEEAKTELLKAIELKGDNTTAIIVLGRLLNEVGDKEESRKYSEQAYNILMRKWHEGNLRKVDYGWLESVARTLGHTDVASEVYRSRPREDKDYGFNEVNLIISKNNKEDK